MLKFNSKDLEIYKENLKRRKKTFTVERKRGERHIKLNGRKVAKLNRNNSIAYLDKDESRQILSLFASVKKSINKYLVDNNFTIKKVEKKYNSVFTNRPLFDSLPIGKQFYYVDVKHCYWRIAYLEGYITEYYYHKVLEKPDLKLYRNMALACVIAPKEVEYYQSGEKVMTISEDASLYVTVYENIRFTAWNLFGKMAFERIGRENCIGYFTDGILVFEDDLKTVKTILARHKLQHRVHKCQKTDFRQYVNMEEGEIRKI